MTDVALALGVILVSASALPYIRDVLNGRARPRLASWGVWAVLLIIMTHIGAREGQTSSAVFSAISATGCLAVLAAGWRYSDRTLTLPDKIAIAGSAVGIASLPVIENATVIMAISLLVETIAYVPTLLHAWNDPEEESLISWAISLAGAVFLLAASFMAHAEVLGVLYPIYAVTFGSLMLGLLVIGRVRAQDYAYGTE